DLDLHAAIAAPLAQPLADHLGLFHFLRQQHLRRHAGSLLVILFDELSHHIHVWAIGGVLHHEEFTPDELAATDEEDLHASFALRARHGDDIRVNIIAGNHLLAFNDAF